MFTIKDITAFHSLCKKASRKAFEKHCVKTLGHGINDIEGANWLNPEI